MFNEYIQQLLGQNQIIYQSTVEGLSTNQIEFLRALVGGVTTFYSQKVGEGYNLGSVGNMKRIKEALEMKEVTDNFTKVPTLLYPAFELWFRSYYLYRPLFAPQNR